MSGLGSDRSPSRTARFARPALAIAALCVGMLLSAAETGWAQIENDLLPSLAAAPTLVEASGVRIVARVSCWLDALPPIPSSGAPLIVSATVAAVSGPFPRSMRVEDVWLAVAYGLYEEAREVEPQPGEPPGEARVYAVFNSRLARSTELHFVAQLRDDRSGAAYFIAAPPVRATTVE